MAHASGQHAVSRATLMYLVRRALALPRRTGVGLPVAYADTAADVLAHYTDDTRWPRTWVANHVFYHQSKEYNRNRFTYRAPPKSLIKDRAFPELWKRSPRPLFSLLERAQSDQVRAFATEALKADFRAVLREVEPSWVARLVGVGSKAIDEFVVWILTNVPRFEQGAFRSLGLHDAVLRLFDSPSPEARTYAAGYARTHARDLPVSELVRLVDNTSERGPQTGDRPAARARPAQRDRPGRLGLAAGDEERPQARGRVAAEALRREGADAGVVQGAAVLAEPGDVRLREEAAAADSSAAQLGPGFFTDLIDSFIDPDAIEAAARAGRVRTWRSWTAFDVNALDRDFLRRVLLHPHTRDIGFRLDR